VGGTDKGLIRVNFFCGLGMGKKKIPDQFKGIIEIGGFINSDSEIN
jgi:hypothetical protein